ncbi:patatin-like phospholipase family protein [Candidimonas sp. SYP-B2681]|uniref:patatin-like phospholipase family protein n=1 Tax=Candidimonas sp. SYP-B2681 TaxID=2497686 RepID=UPI00351258EF
MPCDTLQTDALTIPVDALHGEIRPLNEDQTIDARLRLPPYETVALVLQGGGALGAYQAGVYQGLYEAGIEPTWLAGISIGALNTAIIAGNPPETRIARLTEFWETICQPNFGVALPPFVEQSLFNINDTVRQTMGAWHAASAMLNGQKGFFSPRFPPPPQILPGTSSTASYYDTTMLKGTLERLCDFDRINSGEHHVSVGAVNVRTGNFVYFENQKIKLRPEHFMASGALPPAFAPVEIDGEHYWDGGLVSNTPLAHVLESRPMRDTLAFQVDLWSARGVVPSNMSEVSDRIKDIQYSSRTRLVTDQLRFGQNMRHMLRRILEDTPPELLANDQFYRLVQDLSCGKRYNVIHLIYRNKPYEQHYKDYQFGLAAMREHWQGGLEDIQETLKDPGRLAMPDNFSGFVTHDVHGEEIERRMQGYTAPVLNHQG